ERLGDGAKGKEGPLGPRSGPHATSRTASWTAVVVVDEAHLARRHQAVASDGLAGVLDHHLAIGGEDHHVFADELAGHRVARRADADGRELVDAAALAPAQRRSQ